MRIPNIRLFIYYFTFDRFYYISIDEISKVNFVYKNVKSAISLFTIFLLCGCANRLYILTYNCKI